MDKQKDLFNKTLVFGIVVLLFSMCIFLSNGIIAEDYHFNNQKDMLYCNHNGYIFSSESSCFLYDFILSNPGNLTCICEERSAIGYLSFYGATISNDNIIYTVEYNSGVLWKLNPNTCEWSLIGGGGTSLIGISFDLFSEKLYASSTYNYLFRIDPETGEQEQIGPFGGGSTLMVGMAFDSEGTLYGWDLSDRFWEIDTETGEATEIGPLGININSPCDGDFCKEDDIFYIVIDNYLYSWDKGSGDYELSPQGQFPDYVSVTALAIPYELADTTPPETTYTLDPPEPDGENGWYISNVTVALNATDDMSGVKEIRYTINGGPLKIIPGDNGSFILSEDGNDISVVFWAVDNAGNVETPKNSFTIDIDQTKPDIDLTYEITGGNWLTGWEITFTATVTDTMSGICLIEFYLNEELQDTITGPGPEYSWTLKYYPLKITNFKVIAYTCAGNYAEAFVNDSDIKTCFRSISQNQYPQNIWNHWFFDNFLILEVFLRIMEILR